MFSPMAEPAWEAQQLRVSLFPSKPLEGEFPLWHAIAGEQPERIEREPRQALFRESGAFRNGTLTVAVTPVRADVLYGVVPKVLPDNRPPAIGPFLPAFESFSTSVSASLDRIGFQVARIAFAGTLVQPVKDREAGYRLLQPLVPSLKIDPEQMRDLVYRINWPEENTGIEGLAYINRLTTWSVQRLVTSLLGSGLEQPIVMESDLVQLEFDHNTPAEKREAIDPDRMPAIFDLLTALALANAQRGERP